MRKCGSGVWLEEGSEHSQALRVPGPERPEKLESNQVGEIRRGGAVMAALEKITNYDPLTIRTDSRYVEKWEDQRQN